VCGHSQRTLHKIACAMHAAPWAFGFLEAWHSLRGNCPDSFAYCSGRLGRVGESGMTNNIRNARFALCEIKTVDMNGSHPLLSPAGEEARSKQRSEARGQILRRLKEMFPGLPYWYPLLRRKPSISERQPPPPPMLISEILTGIDWIAYLRFACRRITCFTATYPKYRRVHEYLRSAASEPWGSTQAFQRFDSNEGPLTATGRPFQAVQRWTFIACAIGRTALLRAAHGRRFWGWPF